MKKSNTIAIDLAKNIFQVCVFSPERLLVSNQRLSRKQLTEFLVKQVPSIVVIEACYSSHYWARKVQSMEHEVRIIPAQHAKPFVRGNKNDTNDAIAIAEASWRPNIRFVPVKTLEQQDIQALHRIREKLISRRTTVINQTRGLLSEYGVTIPMGLASFRVHLVALTHRTNNSITSLIKQQLASVLQEYDALSARCSGLEKTLRQYAHQNPLCLHLMTLPGVGVINATALYASVGNASQFSHPRELAVWLGITPKQYASGEKSFYAGITKRGDRYLRKQLIHGARSVIHRVSKKNDKLSVWVKQLVARRGKNKAVVALANRLARLAWLLLQRNEDYRPQHVTQSV